MKQKHLLKGLALGVLLLTGCSSNLDSVTVNTMTIEKDGRLQDVSVEDYSGVDYDMSSLEEFINQEISDYNTQAGADSVVLSKLEIDGTMVKLLLSYADMDDYNAFNHTSYEYGNLTDMKLSGDFTSVADGSTVKAADIQDAGVKVLKIEDAMNIVCKSGVLYYNSNVTAENGVFTASGEGTAIIILK